MRFITFVIFCLLLHCAAASARAQVFEPVSSRLPQTSFGTRNSFTIQASQFKWDGVGLEGENGVLISGDFAVGKDFGIGGWFATDRQSGIDLQWYELHLTWLFSQSRSATFGVFTGALGTNLRSSGISVDINWAEFGLMGSFNLDASSKRPSRWSLGFNLGALTGGSSSLGSQYQAASGFTYGASLSYRASKLLSLNFSGWVMDLETGAKITRLNAGIGFHF